MTLRTGPLVDILPGAITPGSASAPVYGEGGEPFAGPVWGGTASGLYARGGVVATFDAPITQIGVIAGREGQQVLTVWDKQGEVIAEILWAPSGDAWFLGIDTVGRGRGRRRAQSASHGSARSGSLRNCSSVRLSRKASTSARSCSVSSKPRMKLLL